MEPVEVTAKVRVDDAGCKRGQMYNRKESLEDSSSDESEPLSRPAPVSRVNSTEDLDKSPVDVRVKKKLESLQERGKIPNSFYLTLTAVVLLERCSGIYQRETFLRWWSSVTTSSRTIYDYLEYLKELMESACRGELRDTKEYMIATIVSAVVSSLVGIFIVAPFRAGVWTGQRASRHRMHRYMGLLFLIQYGLAWVEFLTSKHDVGEIGFIPHTLALNGIVQGYSAYFSFKVLPVLKDAGYYSDKGVMSRDFLHENIFYQTMCLFGSLYYDSGLRTNLRSSLTGRFLELVFLFFPYAILRPFFPTTRFRDAGTQNKTRTKRLEKFYEIGTTMIKIFYLWAKYFLGFHLNFMLFLGIIKPANFMFVRGLFLLNVGTVSIAPFLHTLRFKKILPPVFTFSFYLCQIYATFTALPYALDTLVSHPKLCAVSMAGLLCNMTRNRKIHAVWCVCTMVLLSCTSIDW